MIPTWGYIVCLRYYFILISLPCHSFSPSPCYLGVAILRLRYRDLDLDVCVTCVPHGGELSFDLFIAYKSDHLFVPLTEALRDPGHDTVLFSGDWWSLLHHCVSFIDLMANILTTLHSHSLFYHISFDDDHSSLTWWPEHDPPHFCWLTWPARHSRLTRYLEAITVRGWPPDCGEYYSVMPQSLPHSFLSFLGGRW